MSSPEATNISGPSAKAAPLNGTERIHRPPTFRAVAHSLVGLDSLDDQGPVAFRGGEGVRHLVAKRESKPGFLGGDRSDYWRFTLLAWRGRALPVQPLALYVIYCACMVTAIIVGVPGYRAKRELAGLQFPIQTLGLALFLLLVFRTNSSYDRWWEGRKVWDGINSRCQDMGRMALAWISPKDVPLASSIIRWSIAFAVTAKRALRNEKDFHDLDGILTPADIRTLQSSFNPSSQVLLELSRLVVKAQAHVPPAIANGLDNNVRLMAADVNACLRIFGTPMPFAYIVHLRSFMVLWLAALPFAFVVNLSWWSILVCCVIGYQLLGFEDIGVEIESPFGYDFNDLPVDQLVYDIFNNLTDCLGKLPDDPDEASLGTPSSIIAKAAAAVAAGAHVNAAGRIAVTAKAKAGPTPVPAAGRLVPQADMGRRSRLGGAGPGSPTATPTANAAAAASNMVETPKGGAGSMV